MLNWKCEALDLKIGNECTFVLVKSKETAKKSIIVIGKPGEIKDLPKRLRYLTQKVESFFFEFDDKIEVLDFLPIQWSNYYHHRES